MGSHDDTYSRERLDAERRALERERRELDRDRRRDRKKEKSRRRRRRSSSSSSSSSSDRDRRRKRAKPALRAPAAIPSAAVFSPPLFRETAAAASFQQQVARFAAAPAPRAPGKFATTSHEQANYLRCKVCGVDSSSETAFAQHLAGGKHRKKNGG
eukprot:CAMPEP_0119294532 /NCGR_PEP_ID=MMETSP1329-20130426/48179_1 /TAXON_ID=114041 /ORGANISM="Genus nov. species nov., Strain RCC1024" /LENGTH=155 /DNA_ID=CAMNT_0007295423 /DNA_START=191 /DNA_END=655 /DNA_ORIENTATION=+